MVPADAPCASCGKIHPLDELELTFHRPDAIVQLSAEQRETDAKESDDLCKMKVGRFFVRAVLPLAVESREEAYNIGIWVEVDRVTFQRVLELWEDPAQEDEPPLAALLANDIPSLPETSGLPVLLELTGPTTRPRVRVPESEHPLHREQCLGISAHRANEYTSFFA